MDKVPVSQNHPSSSRSIAHQHQHQLQHQHSTSNANGAPSTLHGISAPYAPQDKARSYGHSLVGDVHATLKIASTGVVPNSHSSSVHHQQQHQQQRVHQQHIVPSHMAGQMHGLSHGHNPSVNVNLSAQQHTMTQRSNQHQHQPSSASTIQSSWSVPNPLTGKQTARTGGMPQVHSLSHSHGMNSHTTTVSGSHHMSHAHSTTSNSHHVRSQQQLVSSSKPHHVVSHSHPKQQAAVSSNVHLSHPHSQPHQHQHQHQHQHMSNHTHTQSHAHNPSHVQSQSRSHNAGHTHSLTQSRQQVGMKMHASTHSHTHAHTMTHPHIQHKKTKVVLSTESKQALAKVIWHAIRSPDGTIASDLMMAAEATGLPRHAILNAARVAREREHNKRKAAAAQAAAAAHSVAHHPQKHHPQQHQHQHQQQYQHHHKHHSTHRTHETHHVKPRGGNASGNATVIVKRVNAKPNPKLNSKSNLHSHAHKGHFPASSSSSSHNATGTSASNTTSKEMKARAEECAKWKRVHNGVFLLQKGKFMTLPHSVGTIVQTSDLEPAIKGNGSKRRLIPPTIREEAEALQNLLRRQQLRMSAAGLPVPLSTADANGNGTVVRLLDQEKLKRVKIEPKKYAKALDRAARKGRQSVAETLIKQHKELSKAIISHQQDFFKFHRSRRSDAARLIKAVRDTLDKEEKKKQKDAIQAERARLAALKSNDMTAYSKLVEETKNERLKFLMDKTEKSFTQISSLLQQRTTGDGTGTGSATDGNSSSYYSSAHLKMEEVRQPSNLVGGDLKEYQLAGLQWMVSLYNNKLNGILADEMGLGKTIQAISLIAYLMEIKQNLGPYLVIVPLSTLSNWSNEFAKWCPAARLVCYKGTPNQRKELYKDHVRSGHFNVLLTTYEYIIKDKKYLRKVTWQYAIVDEGHRMKNAQSKFAVTLGSQYTTKFRVLLTGTPLMNDLSELWSLLNFLLPSIFNSVETFDQWFSRPFAQFGGGSSSNGAGDEEDDQLLTNEERMLIIHRLHELLRPFMLRRVKSEVLDQLPEKVEKVLRCELSSWQKELYKQISAKVSSSFDSPSNVPSRGLNNVVMQLRKVCNHPYLFGPPEGYHINDIIVRSSGKMALLDNMLPKLRAAGHRVLIFTQMTAVMTILEDYFALRGFTSLRLDGSTPAEERERRMYRFNAPDSPYFIFLLSTRAGGLGLNMTSADTVIIFDSDWNPMMDLQAQDRAHRIGQRNNVSVFRLITNSPVEEKILSRATEKLNMSELVVEAGKFNKRSVESDNSLERKQIMEVLLTDFDTTRASGTTGTVTTPAPTSTTECSGSVDGEDENDDNSTGTATGDDEKEDLNELLSNNEVDYQLYSSIDKKGPPAAELFTRPEDVPDWVKYPNGKKQQQKNDNNDTTNGLVSSLPSSRKRKAVAYDDGLTERQFLRLMEKRADEEEAASKAAKNKNKNKNKNSKPSISEEQVSDDDDSNSVGDEEEQDSVESDSNGEGPVLTDWTYRKLINCIKSVIALKEASTRRKYSEIFIDKPCRQQFPDYYELIAKPIAINDMLRKCRSKLYATLSDFRQDWQLMVDNAVQFNGADSWVVDDANRLTQELERTLEKNELNKEETLSKSQSKKTSKATPTAKKKKSSSKKPSLRIKLSLKTIKDTPSGGSSAQIDVPEQPPSAQRKTRTSRKRQRRNS